MCSVFRRRIANQIISRLKPFLGGLEKVSLYDALPLYIKFSQPKGSAPRFEVSWRDILKLKPDLSERVHLTSLMTYLKNQNFPTNDGLTSVNCEVDNQEKIVFTAEQDIFISSVLLNIISRIEDLPLKSTFFKNIPPEIVIAEYSSPNIAKPFHYGHFRSTIIGNFIANICEYVGHDVTRINYIGDWGLQYGILAVGFNEFGSYEKLARDPLGHLFEVYRDANAKNMEDPLFNEKAKEYFRKMEEGDSDVLKLWKDLREISLQKMDETYRRLKVKFDVIHSESMYFEKSEEIIARLMKDGLAHCNQDGSVEMVVEPEKEESVILRKRDGTSLYLSRDLAAAIDRQKKYHFDSMYYVVDTSQSKHFSNLKNVLNSMKLDWESNVHHTPFGRVVNFSTRKGNVVFLHDILNEAQDRTLEKMCQSPTIKVTDNLEEVADVLGVSCLIISDFSCRRRKDINFSWDKVLSMTDDSGISLQHCHARLCSIQRNCGFEVNSNCELLSLVEPEAISLIAHLAKFEEVIYHAYTSMEPCVIVHYLFLLKNEVGRAIQALHVKDSSPYVAKARLLLFHSAQLVLKKSFEILGITPLSEIIYAWPKTQGKDL